MKVPDIFTEAYEVLQTLELHGGSRAFRIEVVRPIRARARRRVRERTMPDITVCYYEQFDDVWKQMIGPAWVRQEYKHDAAHQALVHLADYVKRAIEQKPARARTKKRREPRGNV